MAKAELVMRRAKHRNQSKKQSQKPLEALTRGIQESLWRGERVTVVGVGPFSVLSRAARKRRNPRTGGEIWIPGGKMPTFKVGTSLREVVTLRI